MQRLLGSGWGNHIAQRTNRVLELRWTARAVFEPSFPGEMKCGKVAPLSRSICAREYARRHPTIASTLDHWTQLIEEGDFANRVKLRRALPTADQATVKSGRTVTIFDITNHYRLITAVHYNHQLVFILLLLTHNEYDQGHWKKKL